HIYGGAVQLGYALTDAWTIQTQAEVVRRLAAGGDDLPRTAPVRLRHELQYGSGGFDAYVGLEQVLRSVYVADSEEETPGYELVFAGASYNIEPINTSVWVKANNLLDQYAQDHSSFIKEQSPLLGRQFQLGVTANF
ncbi:MAG: hypothetical protein SVC26_02640, partial [Pseudomonadota bacterium]|nr:hypothetical protein [Pseudomonadota bacterium]